MYDVSKGQLEFDQLTELIKATEGERSDEFDFDGDENPTDSQVKDLVVNVSTAPTLTDEEKKAQQIKQYITYGVIALVVIAIGFIMWKTSKAKK